MTLTVESRNPTTPSRMVKNWQSPMSNGPKTDEYRQSLLTATAMACHPCRVNVLVVEDDDAIAEPLVKGLERQGFSVHRESTGLGGVDAFRSSTPVDIILLDLGLPDIDGYEVCRRVRSDSLVPIIILTARGDEIDRVLGLELGADDYMVKPFGFRELIARINAVTRRSQVTGTQSDDIIKLTGGVVIDNRTRRVTIKNEELSLTRKEFDLLALLASDPGATQTRETILEQVWDAHWYGPTKTLDVHIASLRKKLGDPTIIETVRGVGFRLRTSIESDNNS
jgi:two-component system, OmpR family, response regulator RegX3